MEFNEADAKKLVIGSILLILAVLAFLILQPVFVSVITGLLLAYIFLPVYKYLVRIVRYKSLAAGILLAVLILIIVIPFWIFFPNLIDQFFALFRTIQTLNISQVIRNFFPGASEQFVVQVSLVFNDLSSNLTSLVLNYLLSLSTNIPNLLIQFLIIAFVFFFTIKDTDALMKFVSDISPFGKSKRAALVSHFRGITDSIIYGHIIAGIVQGLFAGIGFYFAGFSNSAVLTLITMIICIIPFLGAFIMWVPASIYLFATGNTTITFIYLIYNIVIVANIDNLIRTYIVSRRTDISQAVILVGMMGGLLVFGVIGLIIGPLILGYFIIFLKSYKDKTLYALFSDEK